MMHYYLLTFSTIILLVSCGPSPKDLIIKNIGVEEYQRLMEMNPNDFDQSPDGLRKYSGDHSLVEMIVHQYLDVNDLSGSRARNIHWHLGQIHAFNGNYEAAISEMKLSYDGGTVSWECYVSGTIAFLERDKTKLQEAYDSLYNQNNIMNIEVLDRLIQNFDLSYKDAYSQF